MKSNRLSILPLVLIVLVLTSCSGLPPGAKGGGNNGGGNNTTFTLTMISQSQARPGNFTILAFGAMITSLTLTQASGNSMPLALAPTPFPVDIGRLSTDTAVLGTFPVPSGISFNGLTMALSNFIITIHNETGGSIGTCPNLAVCEFSPAPATITITANVFPGGFTAGQAKDAFLTVLPQDIVTVNNAGLSLVFNQNTPVSSQLDPRPGLPANAVDTLVDFTGVVTAVSTNSISVKTGTGLALATTLAGTVTVDDPQQICKAATISVPNCAPVGTIVSIDGIVNANGSVTTTEVDILDKNTPAVDAVEGTIFATGPGTFSMVVTDKQVASNNATLAAANIGDIFAVNGLNAATFAVDTKNLTTANPPVPVNLFTSSGDILSGQSIRVHVTSATGTAAAGNQTLTASTALLRFTRFTGNASTVSGNLFDVSALGSFYQVANQSVVQTYPGVTSFDNTSMGINGIGNAAAPLVSVRALFLNSANNFYAATARHQ